jgi:hypothetical protein
MFARLFLMLIAIALVFGSVHAGPGLVDHHDDHDSASLAFNHHHDSNISSAELDIAMTKIEATAFDDRGLVFAAAPAFMRSVTQKPLIEPPLA